VSKHIPSQLAGEGGPKGRVGGSEPSPAWKWLGIVLVDLGEGAELAARSAAVAVALAGVWEELARPAELPPIADISAPSAVPATVRAGLNGSFLGIDELFSDRPPPPRGYSEAAGRVVVAKTAEYLAWLEARS